MIVRYLRSIRLGYLNVRCVILRYTLCMYLGRYLSPYSQVGRRKKITYKFGIYFGIYLKQIPTPEERV